MLAFKNLGIRFGGNQAVDNVSGSLAPGKITAIIGPNGAGKTTFFNMLSGFYKPTSGVVTLDDQPISGRPTHEVVGRGVARTFQTTTLYKNLSALENAVLGHRVRTRAGLWDALLRSGREQHDESVSIKAAHYALTRVGLDHKAHLIAGSLSQEEQKRVSIASALATNPSILLLDEPAGGLNPEETAKLMRLIRELVTGGLTVALIEHKMSLVMGLADHIMVLHHGQLIAEGTPAQVSQNPAVITAYLGTHGSGGQHGQQAQAGNPPTNNPPNNNQNGAA
ncbi:ABC transporter ATP-binding protein [Deinococcus psychrotolerans]|uniref:ABC transporter ATP-binding protein n=1 Tax=Deinococcus psychrotolerans TaxID=2489213 RepID=A0A3G8YL95_9DEIO|nr:ABC transporter ATP-binding protein [Deinococcus psychrotolerans]AZI42361.1 ABC transporter ATP-binding protein [Deinococcus psychrotolerans]